MSLIRMVVGQNSRIWYNMYKRCRIFTVYLMGINIIVANADMVQYSLIVCEKIRRCVKRPTFMMHQYQSDYHS